MPKPLPLTRQPVTAPTDGQAVRARDAWQMPLDRIQPNPWQPRQHADSALLDELITDIRERGIMQPLVVRPLGEDHFQVVAGERRYQAAKALHLKTVPVRVQEYTDEEARAASIRENVHREPMDPEDEGLYYLSLQDEGMSVRQIGAAIGKNYQYVQRRITLVKKPGALAAYRAGAANLADLAGEWEAPSLVPMDQVGQIVTLSDSLGGFVQSAAVTESHNAAGWGQNAAVTESHSSVGFGRSAVVTESHNIETAPRSFQRRQAIYKPFQSLSLHMERLAPTTLDRDERQELRATIRTLQTQLANLTTELGEE